MTSFLILSRWQFAMTSVFHFFFVPLTLGLVLFVTFFEWKYVVTKDEKFKKLTQFWGKLFIINFAVGVVTGIVQEFQFGMNWSEYSRFVGDIFGAPLAIEALLAFFLESTFIGVWLFGWDKLSPKVHFFAILMVAVGTNLSALWILIANSWMQHPVGFDIVDGKARLNDFMAVLSNPYLPTQFFHLIVSAYVTASFFVLGISAMNILRNKDTSYFKTSFRYAANAAVVFTLVGMILGHASAVKVAHDQPMKLAAMEALWETANPAPFSIVSVFDQKERKDSFTLKVPSLLSLLIYGKTSGEVKGVNELEKQFVESHGEGDYVPSAPILYISFRIMAFLGIVLFFVAIFAWLYIRKGEVREKVLGIGYKPAFKLLVIFIFAPFIANSFGWIVAEMGRFPWMVYGLLDIKHGVTPTLSTLEVVISTVVYAVVYLTATIALIVMIKKHALKGITEDGR